MSYHGMYACGYACGAGEIRGILELFGLVSILLESGGDGYVRFEDGELTVEPRVGCGGNLGKVRLGMTGHARWCMISAWAVSGVCGGQCLVALQSLWIHQPNSRVR